MLKYSHEIPMLQPIHQFRLQEVLWRRVEQPERWARNPQFGQIILTCVAPTFAAFWDEQVLSTNFTLS